MPYNRPRTTLAATVGMLRELFAGGRVHTSEGPPYLYDARLAILPMQQRLPIYLAAIGPKALRLAGAIADGVLLNAYTPPAYVRYAVQEVRQAAQAAGRDPAAVTIACMLIVRLTDDLERLRPTLKQRLVRLLAEPYVGEILLDKGGFDPTILGPLRAAAQPESPDAVSLVSDAMVEAFYLTGTQAQCIARLEEYCAAGVDLPLLLPRLEDYAGVVEAFRPASGI
jgi:5,10-methylenetetrahydromethanopterin reductase